MITQDSIDFSRSHKVISSAQKFIILVPAMPGEPLVYPDGAQIGQPIVDYQGHPVGAEGLVFRNGVAAGEGAWQAVRTDGQGVIILNQVTQVQAVALLETIAAWPSPPSLSDYKAVLERARALGITDMYNSDQAFIKAKMTAVGQDTPAPGVDAGLYKRDDRDICQAIFLPGPGSFHGPTAGAESFGPEGVVIIKQGDSVRSCEPGIFEATYKNVDGSDVASATLPLATGTPAGLTPKEQHRIVLRNAAEAAPIAPGVGPPKP